MCVTVCAQTAVTGSFRSFTRAGTHQADLFWFGRPKLLLNFMQVRSLQHDMCPVVPTVCVCVCCMQAIVFLCALNISMMAQSASGMPWYVIFIVGITTAILVAFLHSVT